MAHCEEREFLLSQIAILQGQQLAQHQEERLHGWSPEESTIAFDIRISRMAALVRQLAALDELQEP